MTKMKIVVDCSERDNINPERNYVIVGRFGLSSRFMGEECLEIAEIRKLNKLVLFSADESRMYID